MSDFELIESRLGSHHLSAPELKVNECTFGYLLKQTIKITDVHFLTNKLSKIINYIEHEGEEIGRSCYPLSTWGTKVSSHFNSPLNPSILIAWVALFNFKFKSFQSNVLLSKSYGASVLEHRPIAPSPLPFLSKDIYHT